MEMLAKIAKKKLLPSALLSVIVTSILFSVTAAQSVAQVQGDRDRDRRRAEQLLQLCSRSQERVRESMEDAKGRGISVTAEAENMFQEGNRLRLEAEAAFGEGNYAKCANLCLEAMHHYKASIRILMMQWEETPRETAQGKAVGLVVAIERVEIFIDRLSAMATKAEDLGYNVTEIREVMQEASSHLDNAKILLADGDVSGAAQKLGEARQILSGIVGELNRLTSTENRNRVERSVENIERLIEDLQGEIEELERGGADVTSAQKALDGAVSYVNAAKADLNKWDTDGAIESLRQAWASLREARLALHTRPVVFLGGIDKMEEKIKELKDGLKDLEDQGIDVQEILGLLQDAEESLRDAREASSKGDREKAVDNLGQARELYLEALRKARDLTRPGRGSGQDQGPKRGPRDHRPDKKRGKK